MTTEWLKTTRSKGPNPKIPFKHIDEKLPPNDRSIILTWHELYGYNTEIAFIFLQHHKHDQEFLGKPRVTHWLLLERIHDKEVENTELSKPQKKRTKLL